MKCKWCGKEFRSESTLAVHMCVKKRRWTDRDMSHIRLSHRAFQMYYEIHTSAKNPKTMVENNKIRVKLIKYVSEIAISKILSAINDVLEY